MEIEGVLAGIFGVRFEHMAVARLGTSIETNAQIEIRDDPVLVRRERRRREVRAVVVLLGQRAIVREDRGQTANVIQSSVLVPGRCGWRGRTESRRPAPRRRPKRR